MEQRRMKAKPSLPTGADPPGAKHGIIEYPMLKGTHKDHQVHNCSSMVSLVLSLPSQTNWSSCGCGGFVFKEETAAHCSFSLARSIQKH